MQKTIKLNNGIQMPVLGLGTWRSDKGRVGQAVEHALACGYRHIDCASIYGNEKEIGLAFKSIFAGKIERNQVFVTSKLWNTSHHPDRVEQACRQTLADLQLDFLDLYLVHWGIAFKPGGELEPLDKDGMVLTESVSLQSTWKAMERLVDQGLVKAIGVANYTVPMLVDLLNYATIKPVVNQIEIHPYNTQEDAVAYCHKKKIVVTAYSPLGSNASLEDSPLGNQVVGAIAAKWQVTPAQVLIKWSLQRGLVTIPKTTDPKRIKENFQVFDFELSNTEMDQISSLNHNHRFVDPVEWWGVPYFK